MWCSGCGSILTEGRYATIPVDTCGDCGGTWLDEGRLKWVLEVGPRTMPSDKSLQITRFAASTKPTFGLANSETRRIVKCPYCVTVMRPVNYSANSGVAIYRCIADHGVWVPQGGLDRLVVFVDSWDRYLKSTAPYYAGIAQHERRRFLRKLTF